jgi:hypothetical protein
VNPFFFKINSTGRIIADATIISKLPKNAAEPNLNWDTQLITAMGAVVKTPDTTNVAPVSPRDLAKASTVPEKIAGKVNGTRIFRNVVRGAAPNVPEACSKSVDMSSSLALSVFTIYGKVKATCIINIKKGTLRKGITVSICTLPPVKRAPIPEAEVQAIRVANPKPEVGITNVKEMRSSRNPFPQNFFRANMYARGIPKNRSIITAEMARRKDKERYFWISSQFVSPISGLAKTSV